MKILDSHKLYSMTGGIQLNTQRGISLESPPVIISRPTQLQFSLKTKYARYIAAVKAGETIQAGQIVARHLQRQNPLVIRSHYAGTIVHTEPDTIHLETSESSIIPAAPQPPTTLAELQQIIADTGILGLGGAEFPTFFKLGKYIQTLIINGVECEPMLTADACLMTHLSHTLKPALDTFQKLMPLTRIILAVESDKPQAVEALKEAMYSTDIELAVIPTRYPAGGSRQLFEQLYGFRLNQGERLKDRHIISINIQTLYAISQALAGIPLTQRLVTVTGTGVAQPQNYWIAFGTPVVHIQNELGLAENLEIIKGGPLMGMPATAQDVIQAGTSALLFNRPAEVPLEMPCIDCGHCEQPCPEQLMPQSFVHYTQNNPHGSPEADEALTQLNLNACIECGLCNLVCPSHIPLSQQFTQAKIRIRASQDRQRRSESARLKYEVRQLRLAKPKKANPMPVKAVTAQPKPNASITRARSSATKLKSALAKAQRLAREASAALVQAEKTQKDEQTLQAYRDRVAQMRAKAEQAQAEYNAATATAV